MPLWLGMIVTALAVMIPWRPLAAQTAVAVGAGSYASSVPAAVAETDSYYGLPADQISGANSIYPFLHLDPSLFGKPLPTNHWWTDLLIADRSYLPSGATEYQLQQATFGGNQWVYPSRVNPQSYGLDIYYPTAWQGANADYSQASIDSGTALQIHGDRGYAVPPGDVVVADFESGYPAGWTTQSVAGHTNPFLTGPVQSTWTGQSPAPAGYVDGGYVDTFLAGSNNGANDFEGILSGTITIQKHYIHLLVGGGNDTANTVVRLRVNGTVIKQATGQQSSTLAWNTWDVSAYNGQTATVEIVDTTNAGWGFILCDEIVQSDASSPVGRYGRDFIADNSAVTNWGDWNVDFRLTTSTSAQEVDVTMARGVPFTWTTWKNGLMPRILVPAGTAFLNTANGAISTASGSFVTGAFSFVYQGRTFGVFLPDNTTVTVGSGYIEPQLSGSNNYMVVGCLPDSAHLSEFNAVAFARPTNTQISWNYNPSGGYVSTNWTITTTPLKGSNLNTIQGWLPHHYRKTNGLPPFSAYTYLTPRGTMQCTTGTNFTINFPFKGLVPILPAPVVTGDANAYQPARMAAYLSSFDPGTMMGDTYWSGKGMALCAQYMAWAAQSGDTADYNRLKGALENAFTDWMTYTPGEENKSQFGFFTMYSDWHAFIGFGASYGSQAFNDLHFHYGYFTTAASTLALYDPAFVAKYKPMLTLIAKSYANYDRTDTSEPFLRTFDVWEGHSNAGGVGNPTGENQESSSEAMQGWAGLFMLGGVSNDSAMTAAGAMGYAIEGAATDEYWEDLSQTNFPSVYHRGYAGQVYGGSYAYGTFFSGDPAWVYAIQWGPSNHWLNYLTPYNLSVVSAKYNAMWTERANWAAAQTQWDANTAYTQGHWVTYNKVIYSPKANWPAGNPPPPQDINNWNVEADCSKSEPDVLGDSPGHVVHAFQALIDPDTAAAEFDRYYANNEPITGLTTQAGSTYYLIHSIRQAGQQDFTASTTSPLSSVYYNSKTGKYSYLVYNPSTSQQNVTVYRNGAVVGTFPVPAQTLIDSHLDEALKSLTLTPSSTAQTIQIGQTLQFTATGYDQYGATFPLGTTTWSVNGGGTISTSGLFTATANAYPVTVTAVSGGQSAFYTFRVAPTPVLTSITITPGFTRVIQGGTAPYSAAGVDQYGNAYSLGTVTWSVTGSNGSISATGLFTASTVGTGYVKATSGSVSSTAPVAVHAPLANIALHRPVTASTTNGNNVAANLVDGDAVNTRWESAIADNQYVYVDLGKVYDLSSINIVWENAYASTYEVDLSNDASTWTPVANPPTKTSSAPDNLSITGTGRYVRLKLITRTNPAWGFSIYELQVYGYINGASIVPATVLVNPTNVTTPTGQQTPFQAYAFDTNADGGPATATWKVSGGGTISSTGVFSATTAGGPFTVTATVGAVSGTTGVTVGTTASTLTNVALGQAATASSSENSGTTPNLAVDGNTNTRWSSAATDTEWITVDLGASTALSSVVLNWESAYGKKYTIQGSNDNATWTLLATQNNGPGGIETLSVSGSYRYVKMQGVQRATQWGYSLWEFQVMSYYPTQKTNKALNQSVTASSVENSGLVASYAVDGNLNTRWSSASTDSEWITVNLGTPTKVSQVVLNWEAAYGKQYIIQGSNDNATWTPLYTQTNGLGGTETLNVSGTYQYIRMQGKQRALPYGYSLWELQVY